MEHLLRRIASEGVADDKANQYLQFMKNEVARVEEATTTALRNNKNPSASSPVHKKANATPGGGGVDLLTMQKVWAGRGASSSPSPSRAVVSSSSSVLSLVLSIASFGLALLAVFLAGKPVLLEAWERFSPPKPIYPNHESPSGYLFLDPPRTVATYGYGSEVPFMAEQLENRMGWTVVPGPDANASLFVTFRSANSRAICPPRQPFNHFKGSLNIITKGLLAENIKRYYQRHPHLQTSPAYDRFGNPQDAIPLKELIPETYVLSNTEDCREFFSVPRPGVWISKETTNSMGRGIRIIKDVETELRPYFAISTTEGVVSCRRTHSNSDGLQVDLESGEIIQRYVIRPLLLNGVKSETRAYWLIASTKPFIVLFYKEGTVRLNTEQYSPNDFKNPLKHLTNVHQQQTHPQFHALESKLKWSYDEFQSYLEMHHSVAKGYVRNVLQERLKLMVTRAFNATKEHIVPIDGEFSILGADFILDENLRPTIMELQGGPGMSTVGIKGKFLSDLVLEAVDIVLEIQHLKNQSKSLRSLQTPRGGNAGWEILLNEAPA